MCIGYLGFVLLVWFPAVLRAQSAAQHCAAPGLDGGFFAPKQETYSHGAKLTYSCNDGRKPAVKGWWATITCQNGTWSHEPQCIDKRACLPPTSPNGKYTASQDGWYEEENTIRITCDDGYTNKDNRATAKCVNGTWSSLPVCERSEDSCGEPPQIPHAVVIQGYQEVFGVDARVTYECEDGYTVEGGEEKKTIVCTSGLWSEPPTCRSSGSDGRDSKPLITRVQHCGAHPVVENGVVVEDEPMFLKYRCANFYKLVGSDTVTCYSDGTWSQLPVCKEAFCILKPGQYLGGYLSIPSDQFIPEGEKKIRCIILRSYSATVQCRNGELTFTGRCCDDFAPGSCL